MSVLLRRAGPVGVAPLPLMTQQRVVSGRTASACRSDRVAQGAARDHMLMPYPRLGQSSRHGNRKQRYGDSFYHVQPPY